MQMINNEINGNTLNGTKALKYALDLEVSVTKSINNIIISCEDPEGRKPIGTQNPTKNINDYHVSFVQR